MGQIPKTKIIKAEDGTKLTFKINGQPVQLDEESVDTAAKQNLDKLVSSGELSQDRVQEFWDAHSKFKENAKKGIYNIDTAGPNTVAGIKYEGEASPETLGKTSEGGTAERGAVGRFFTKTLKHDPASIMSRYNASVGASIGGLGLQKLQSDANIADEKAATEKLTSEKKANEEKIKAEQASKIPSIKQAIGQERFGGTSNWEDLWKDLPETEKVDVLSKHASNIISNKDIYLKGKDQSWINKYAPEGVPKFTDLNTLKDFFSHIYGAEGLDYLVPTGRSKEKTKTPEESTKNLTSEGTETPIETSNEYLYQDPTKKVETSTPGKIDPILKRITDERVNYFKRKMSAVKGSILDEDQTKYDINQENKIKSELSTGISIDDYINKLTQDISDKKNTYKRYLGVFGEDTKDIENRLAKAQQIKKTLPLSGTAMYSKKRKGGIIKGADGLSFDFNTMLPESLQKKGTGPLVPFTRQGEPSLQKIQPLAPKVEASSKTGLPTLPVKTQNIALSSGIKQSGISKLISNIPKLDETQKLNLRELGRVALLNQFQPDIRVEAPLVTPVSETRVPIKGDYTSMALASQQANKIRSNKPITGDATLALLGSQRAEEKAGQIEQQGQMADLQARKQGESQDIAAQQQAAGSRAQVAAKNVQALAGKTQAEREAKNQLASGRVQNWDTFLASLNLEKKAKLQQTESMKKQLDLQNFQQDLYSNPKYAGIRQKVVTSGIGNLTPDEMNLYREFSNLYSKGTQAIQLGKDPYQYVGIQKQQLGGSISKAKAKQAATQYKENVKSAKTFSDIYDKWMNKKLDYQKKNISTETKDVYDLVKKALK